MNQFSCFCSTESGWRNHCCRILWHDKDACLYISSCPNIIGRCDISHLSMHAQPYTVVDCILRQGDCVFVLGIARLAWGTGALAFTRGTVKRDNDLTRPRYLSRNHHNAECTPFYSGAYPAQASMPGMKACPFPSRPPRRNS